MNDFWKKENLHQELGFQGVVWTTQPNPFKEGEVALVADDREKRLNWKMGLFDNSLLVVMEYVKLQLFK